MFNNFIIILFALILSSCVSTDPQTVISKPDSQNVPSGQNKVFPAFDKVDVGMSYSDVLAAMGYEVVIGYEKKDDTSQKLEPIISKQPYKTDVFIHEEKIYEALYYFTSIKKADGVISEDELTPFVFLDGKLVGIGQEYLFKVRNGLP